MTINEESITSINGTTETELQNICSSKENDDPSSLDALFLSEVYEQILNRLKELLEEHKFEKEPNIDKQKLHENAGKDDEEAEGEKKFVRGIHYTLRFMWKILQHVGKSTNKTLGEFHKFRFYFVLSMQIRRK
jgi:hypothetical protein